MTSARIKPFCKSEWIAPAAWGQDDEAPKEDAETTEETAEPVGYYDKLPNSVAPNIALVLDPMLATGGSVELVVKRLLTWGVQEIRVLSIIASQEGLDRVHRDFPDVNIYVAAIDPVLNDQSFIVPGLGDAGDLIFDTPQQG